MNEQQKATTIYNLEMQLRVIHNMGVFGMSDTEFEVAISSMMELGRKVVEANANFVSDPETICSVAKLIILRVNSDYGSDEDEPPDPDLAFLQEAQPPC